MSEFPKCHHGWNDPNFACQKCRMEDEISRLQHENAELRHDIARAASTTTELATECEQLRAQLAEALKDSERLDFLDSVNKNINAHYGTTYGWRLDVNHNRAQLSDHQLPALSVRQALDAARGGGG